MALVLINHCANVRKHNAGKSGGKNGQRMCLEMRSLIPLGQCYVSVAMQADRKVGTVYVSLQTDAMWVLKPKEWPERIDQSTALIMRPIRYEIHPAMRGGSHYMDVEQQSKLGDRSDVARIIGGGNVVPKRSQTRTRR